MQNRWGIAFLAEQVERLNFQGETTIPKKNQASEGLLLQMPWQV
jgi:hypothetical protein